MNVIPSIDPMSWIIGFIPFLWGGGWGGGREGACPKPLRFLEGLSDLLSIALPMTHG